MVFQNMIFTFYSEFLIQRLFELSPRCMPCAPPNPTLIKMREAYWCYFSVLAFSLPPPGNFSADALDYKYNVWEKNAHSFYTGNVI